MMIKVTLLAAAMLAAGRMRARNRRSPARPRSELVAKILQI